MSLKRHKPIYVIAGGEESLVNARCEELVHQLVEPSQRATGLFVAEGVEVSIRDVLDELRTAPFLTDKRVVVVRSADKFVFENRRLLENYFDNPCATAVLILAVSSWPKQTKLAKKLPKVGRLIEVAQPKPHQLPGRLCQYAGEAHDKRLARDAAELLIELAGDDLVRLYREVDKLALFAHKKKVIDVRDVELLIGHNRMFNAFAVIDACLAGSAAQAVNRLRSMFAADKSAEYTVVGAFAYHLRRMFNAKALLEKGLHPEEVAKRLQIWSNKEAFFAQLRQVSLKHLGSALQRLAAIDYAIKTGQTTAEVAIERLVLRLTTG